MRKAPAKYWLVSGLLGLSSLAACGRIGFEDAQLSGGADTDAAATDAHVPVDANSSHVDAEVADATATVFDAALIPIDAANLCNAAVPLCPSESFELGVGTAAPLTAELINQPNVVMPIGDLCGFPDATADYSYQINLLDSGVVTINSPSRTGWYLLNGECAGTMVMCSPTGSLQTENLAAGTYTLVVEEVDSTAGECKTFDVNVLGPPGGS